MFAESICIFKESSAAKSVLMTKYSNYNATIGNVLLSLLITLVSQGEDVPVTSKNQTVQTEGKAHVYNLTTATAFCQRIFYNKQCFCHILMLLMFLFFN